MGGGGGKNTTRHHQMATKESDERKRRMWRGEVVGVKALVVDVVENGSVDFVGYIRTYIYKSGDIRTET